MFCYEHHPKLFENFESCSPGVVQFELDGDHDTNQLAEFSSHHQRCQGVCPRWTQAAGLCIIFSCAPTVWVPKNSWSGRKKKISRSLPAFKQQLDRWIDNCAQVLHVLRLSAARWIRCRQFWGPRFHLGRAAPMGWFVQFCLAYRYVPASYNGKSEALMDTDVSTRFLNVFEQPCPGSKPYIWYLTLVDTGWQSKRLSWCLNGTYSDGCHYTPYTEFKNHPRSNLAPNCIAPWQLGWHCLSLGDS